MDQYYKHFEVRWADVDANRHVRHSAYTDYAAHVRICLLHDINMDIETLAKHNLGPVLFREETLFKRELGLNQSVTVDAKLKNMRRDGSRWTFVQHIRISEEEIAAIVTVDGAWLNLKERKLCPIPENFFPSFSAVPRTDDFTYLD